MQKGCVSQPGACGPAKPVPQPRLGKTGSLASVLTPTGSMLSVSLFFLTTLPEKLQKRLFFRYFRPPAQ